jgi:ABC-type amino acid transport substrate-binding protein
VNRLPSHGMYLAAFLAALVAGVPVQEGLAQETAAVKELIPTGKLRVGVVFAPAASAFFFVKDANGEPRGVTVDLANELGKRLGVPLELMVAPNSGLITDGIGCITSHALVGGLHHHYCRI